MFEALLTLFFLVLLQAVLGFDNLLYISLESKRVTPEKQAFVRKMGIGLAVLLRIVLLFIIVKLISSFQSSFFALHLGEATELRTHGDNPHPIHSQFDIDLNFHALIVLFGGVFIIYTAIKEIFHMIGVEELDKAENKPRSVNKTIFWIVLMNLIFSFDSILSAMALAKDPKTGDPNLILMTIAILIGGALMIWLADSVSSFLEKNRMYEVLGLFILFVVGIMLLTEGGHLAHMTIAGKEIVPMTKTTFYFVIAVLVLTDIVQGRYQKRILASRKGTPQSVEEV